MPEKSLYDPAGKQLIKEPGIMPMIGDLEGSGDTGSLTSDITLSPPTHKCIDKGIFRRYNGAVHP